MTPLKAEYVEALQHIAALKKLIYKNGAGKASLMLKLEQLEQEATVTYERLLAQEGQRIARMN